MAEQTTDTVNPGQAIYDALSDEAKAAVDALPDDVFAGEVGRRAAEIVARTALMVNDVNPVGWLLSPDGPTNGREMLSIILSGTRIIQVLNRSVLAIRFDERNVDPAIAAWIEQMGLKVNGLRTWPHVKRVYVPFDGLETIPSQFWIAHRGAAEELNQEDWEYGKGGGNLGWHKDPWRVKVAIVASQWIPAPAYVPEDRYGLPIEAGSDSHNDPGPAVYNSLSDEAKASVDALPEDLFKDDEGVDHRLRFTESIQAVHQEGPQIWSLLNSGEFTALNVQNFNVVSLSDKLRFVVDPGLLQQEVLGDALESYVSFSDYGQHLGIVQVEIDSTTPQQIREELERVHNAAVRRLASANWKKNGQAHNHRDDIRIKLAFLTQSEVPAPSYLTEAFYGRHGYRTVPSDLNQKPMGGVLRNQFAAGGLVYTPSQIASFYTALQTKGFVILSGISGTGKSKIAQRFANMLPIPACVEGPASVSEHGDRNYQVKIRDYMTKYQRFHIPVEATASLPLPEPGTAFNVPLTINGVTGEARIRVRTSSGANLFPKGKTRTEFVSMAKERGFFYLRFALNEAGDLIDSVEIVNDREPDAAIRVRITQAALKYRLLGFPWSQASKSPFPKLAPSTKVPVHLPESTVEGRLENPNDAAGGNGIQLSLPKESQSFIDTLKTGDELLIVPIVRSGQVAEIAIRPMEERRLVGQSERANHLFLPVRPDWRDGKALIGYHNPLSGEYVRTDFLDFVISAADDFAAGNRNAFFVILDEMNLAHVEYYFADVLSVIESGRDAEGWTVEGIPLAVGEEDADLSETLRLPPNLYVIGTVNMDETTHPFSPKVLDRAFTIELTEVDFTDYPPEQMETGEVDEAEKQALLKAFTQGGRYPRIDKSEIAAFVANHEKYRGALQSLNTSLRRSRMHFGYRVFDEIMQFAYNAEENELFTIDEAFDHAVLMKVLPKFNGSRGKLQTALFELIHWCRTEGTLTPAHRSDLEGRFANLIDQGQPFDQIVKTGEDSIDDNWRYPATGKRAALMMQDLYTDGFASFG